MISIKKIILTSLKRVLKKLEIDYQTLSLEHPEKEIHGDYSTNVAITMLGHIKNKNKHSKYKNPKELAQAVIEKLLLEKDLRENISSFEIAEPAFINFRLKQTTFIKLLQEIIKQGCNYGSSKDGKGKTLIIDYSAPNIAKRFSVGHLRSTIIGHSLYNLYRFAGWNVIGDNHLGDWGTQFGKMIVAIQKWADKPANKLSIDELEQLYVEFHQKANENPRLEKEARQAFKALENGKKEERRVWKQLVQSSMKKFQKIYNLLDIKIDVAYGESFYEGIMLDVIKEAKEKKVATESKGALVIPYPNNKLPPGMLLKSDGATTYFTRDLATIKFRKKKWSPDLSIYEVGAEQSLHFQQVFWAAELLGWDNRDKFVHVPHGLVCLKEGKMSTRKGRTIQLENVLQEAIKKASQFNRNPRVAKAVGIGAVKYNDLKRSPTSGYIFDWNEMLSLKGNSGPYLQYTYARCKSVLGKATRKSILNIHAPKLNIEELKVLRWIYRFPEIVLEATQKYAPNTICNFLFELSQRYNAFYNKHRILNAGSDEKRELRLLLTKAVSQVLKNGLTLLGIEALDKM